MHRNARRQPSRAPLLHVGARSDCGRPRRALVSAFLYRASISWRESASLQTIVRMECRIGEFVIEDTPLASVSEARDADPDAVRQINAAYTVGRQRTVDQDAAYGPASTTRRRPSSVWII